jgi:hypothetical protein
MTTSSVRRHRIARAGADGYHVRICLAPAVQVYFGIGVGTTAGSGPEEENRERCHEARVLISA